MRVFVFTEYLARDAVRDDMGHALLTGWIKKKYASDFFSRFCLFTLFAIKCIRKNNYIQIHHDHVTLHMCFYVCCHTPCKKLLANREKCKQ